MAWYKDNGGILKVGGAIAVAEACCCVGGECCDCPWLEDFYLDYLVGGGPGSRIRATFSGAVTGYVLMEPQSGVFGTCYRWTDDGDWSHISTGCALFSLTPGLEFHCARVSTGLAEATLDLQTNPSVDPCVVDTPGEFISGICEAPVCPDQAAVLNAVYRFTVVEGAGGCDCLGQTIDITLTLEDEWLPCD